MIHTLGWPLRYGAKYKEFGGSWIYPMNREGEPDRVSIGFVVGLDYADARLSVHDVLQEFKHHKLVRRILGDGKRVAWGAKAIPEGGYWAMPRLHAPGMVIAGDAAGMVNVPKLKGIHYAIRSGMFAAETLYRQLKAGSRDFSAYEQAVHDSEIGKDLYESRNMKQPFAKGFFLGGAITNAMVVSKGRLPGGHWPTHRDADQELLLTDRHERYPKPDGKYTFDKLSGVFTTGNATRDDAPSHIRIQQRVPRAVGEAWAVDVPRGRLRGPRRRAGERLRRPGRQPVELRAVRGDHGQGRAADAARGRRRARVPGHVAVDARESPPGDPATAVSPWETAAATSADSGLGGRMRRLALLLPLAAALAGPAAPPPPPRPRPSRRRVHAVARRRGAHRDLRGADPRERRAAERLQVRFTLQTRTQGELGYRRVLAPGFGVWLTSDRGVARYSYAKTIANLAAPASYRMIVRFRWLDADGESLRTAKRTSAPCRQPDLRPDLVAEEIDGRAGARSRPAALRRRAAQRGRGPRPRPRRSRSASEPARRSRARCSRSSTRPRASSPSRRPRALPARRSRSSPTRRRKSTRRDEENMSSPCPARLSRLTRLMAGPAHQAPGAPSHGLRERYAEAFRAWLEHRDERELGTAYALGREAVSLQLSVLDLADAHHRAAAEALRERARPARARPS